MVAKKQTKSVENVKTTKRRSVTASSKHHIASKAAVKKRVVSTKAKAKVSTKKLLVPHKANEYRPHLIRPWGLVAVLTVALLSQIVYGYFTTGSLQILGQASNVKVEDLLYETNRQRLENELPELAQSELLNEAARLKAQDMISNDYWAHVSPTGVEPWKWLGQVGYEYDIAGENLAKNYPNSKETVAAWMNSETHRDNILNSRYTEVGFAVVDGVLEGRETTLIVAFYGNKSTDQLAGGYSFGPIEYEASSESGALPLGNFASIFQSMSPVTVISLGVLAVVAVVGAVAHYYRNRLPESWQRNWRKHYGAYTFFGMIAIGILVILATGGGSL